MIEIWGKSEESGTLAHPGLWGWLRSWYAIICSGSLVIWVLTDKVVDPLLLDVGDVLTILDIAIKETHIFNMLLPLSLVSRSRGSSVGNPQLSATNDWV